MSKVIEKLEARTGTLSKGFMQFITQYSVAPLAIGVVVGTAVNDFVKTMVDGLVTPLISLISPESKLQNLQYHFHGAVFKVGAVLDSLISFLVVLLIVYIFVKLILRNDELLVKK